MTDQPSPAKLGLTDEELAAHPTMFAADALKDQVVVVTGGAGGIGRAITWLFARLGAHVVVVGRDGSKLDALVGRLAGRGLKASAHVADIREPDAVNALFDTIWAAHDRVDSLINSAGGQFPQAAIDFSVKGWNAVINTNLNGTWYMMQAAAQRWRDHKHPGSIVNIVVVTTHGLYGIAHNCVAPGAIETEGWNVYTPEARAAYPRSNPMMRVGSPWDVAETSVFLAGPSAKFVTGETLTVDGGGQLWGETWTTGKPAYFSGDDK
jgi:citronellol/citronellal dehydrogenase